MKWSLRETRYGSQALREGVKGADTRESGFAVHLKVLSELLFELAPSISAACASEGQQRDRRSRSLTENPDHALNQRGGLPSAWSSNDDQRSTSVIYDLLLLLIRKGHDLAPVREA